MVNFLEKEQAYETYGLYSDLFVVGLLLILLIFFYLVMRKQWKVWPKKRQIGVLVSGTILCLFLSMASYPLVEAYLYPKDRVKTYIPVVKENSLIYFDQYKMEEGIPVLTKFSINITNLEVITELQEANLITGDSDKKNAQESFITTEYFFNLAVRHVVPKFERRDFHVDFQLDSTLTYLKLKTTEGEFYFHTTEKLRQLISKEMTSPKGRKLKN